MTSSTRDLPGTVAAVGGGAFAPGGAAVAVAPAGVGGSMCGRHLGNRV